MKNLTISIVNYNAGDYLNSCLRSLAKCEKELDFDVTVIDNASTDGSIEKAKRSFPNYKFIINKENLGFGKAHNIVLKNTDSRYVLTLNPDTEVPIGALKHIFEYMEKNKDVGAASGKVIKNDGSLDKASHRGFPTPKASFKYFFLKDDSEYHLSKLDITKTHEVDSIVGAFMFLRRSVLDKVGYFDEDYFLYGEDLDLCYRIKKGGYKVMYLPEVKILHVKGVSSGIKKHSKKSSGATLNTKTRATDSFYETMKIFYKKHYANDYPKLFNEMIYKGIDLKWYMARRKNEV